MLYYNLLSVPLKTVLRAAICTRAIGYLPLPWSICDSGYGILANTAASSGALSVEYHWDVEILSTTDVEHVFGRPQDKTAHASLWRYSQRPSV